LTYAVQNASAGFRGQPGTCGWIGTGESLGGVAQKQQVTAEPRAGRTQQQMNARGQALPGRQVMVQRFRQQARGIFAGKQAHVRVLSTPNQ
jgi:hypothetical protein